MSDSYTYSVFNEYAHFFIGDALSKLYDYKEPPIIVCIGSDLVLGDSLGPLIGTNLSRLRIGAYVYGTLGRTVTAKEVVIINEYLRKTHPNRKILAIDAAVGLKEDVGKIRVLNHGIKPGLGFNKNLDLTGDISIIGIVAEKSEKNHKLLNTTRLNLVYKMAESISKGVKRFVDSTVMTNKKYA